MANDLSTFYEDFMNTVRASAAVEGAFTRDAFVEEFARRLSEAEEVDSLAPAHFEGVGINQRKMGFDAYDFGDEEDQLVLAISHFVAADQIETLIDSEANRLFALPFNFLEAALTGKLTKVLEESSAGYQVAQQLLVDLPRLRKIRIYLITNAALSTRVKGFASRDIGDLVVEFHPWDVQRLHRVEESGLGREEIDIDLTDWVPEGVLCLRAPISASNIETYLAVLPGSMLAGVYQKYGSRVLESNVRSFLSVRSAVNKGIRGTLIKQPEMFLTYNNGITATATAIKTSVDNENRLTIVRVRDLQIVNGGQTTVSIFHAVRDDKALDLADVFVQMKLIVVSQSDEAEIVPRISRYANTQNRISDADFFSNHKFHQRMEEKSRRILAPAIAGVPYQTKWFYERTRGQFNTERSRLASGALRQFDAEYPKAQLLTKTDAAKFIVSWSKLPHIVSAGAQKNFVQFAKEIDEQWSVNEDQFGDTYFRHMIAKGIIFNGLRARAIRSDWYKAEPGYLANIVTYSVAKLVDLIERTGLSFDLDKVWNEQQVTDQLWEALEPIPVQMRRVLTDPRRPVPNVTEWAKRDKCWLDAQAVSMELGPVLMSYTTEKADRAVVIRDDRKDQKLLSGIAAQVRVLERGMQYWLELRDFGVRLNALSPKERDISNLVIGGRNPSEAQAQVLVALETKLIDIGFKSGVES